MTNAKVVTDVPTISEELKQAGHTLSINGSNHGVELIICCHEPKGAHCRLKCKEDCPTWNIDDHEHPLVDSDCLAVEWFGAWGTVQDSYSGHELPLRDGMKVDVRWDGDGWLWEPQSHQEMGTKATVKTIEDVEFWCEFYDWKRLSGKDVHPYAWRCPDDKYSCCISALGTTMTGIHISIPGTTQARENGVPDVQLARIEPYTEESGFLLDTLLAGLAKS